MSNEELMKPRWKVIADYPGSDYHIGEILDRDWGWVGDDEIGFKHQVSHYPHLFKKLEWWEDRTLDELMSVNYIRITIYTGYWRVGDVVNVTDYKIDTKNKKFELYILDGTQQSLPERCIPATLEEYKADKSERSGSKAC